MQDESACDENREIIEEIEETIQSAGVIDFHYEYDCTTTRGVRLWFTTLRLRNREGLPINLDTGGFCTEDKDALGEGGIALFIRGIRYTPGTEVGIDHIDEAIQRDLVTLFDRAVIIRLEGLRYGEIPCYERDGISFYPLKADLIHGKTPEGIPFLFRSEGFCPTNPVHRTKTWITFDIQLMVDRTDACQIVSDEFFREFTGEE